MSCLFVATGLALVLDVAVVSSWSFFLCLLFSPSALAFLLSVALVGHALYGNILSFVDCCSTSIILESASLFKSFGSGSISILPFPHFGAAVASLLFSVFLLSTASTIPFQQNSYIHTTYITCTWEPP